MIVLVLLHLWEVPIIDSLFIIVGTGDSWLLCLFVLIILTMPLPLVFVTLSFVRGGTSFSLWRSSISHLYLEVLVTCDPSVILSATVLDRYPVKDCYCALLMIRSIRFDQIVRRVVFKVWSLFLVVVHCVVVLSAAYLLCCTLGSGAWQSLIVSHRFLDSWWGAFLFAGVESPWFVVTRCCG